MFDVHLPTSGPPTSFGPAAAPGVPGRPLVPGTDKRRRQRKIDKIQDGDRTARHIGPLVNDPSHMLEYTREQITFADNVSKQLPPVMLNMLKRIHVTLGHPSGPDLVRYLTLCGASADTLLGARALRCTICQRHKKPTEARSSRIPRTMRFNARLLIDILYDADCAGKMHLFMGILDEGTHLHVCPLVKA